MHRGGGLGEGTDDLGPRRARRGRHRREAAESTEARQAHGTPGEPDRLAGQADRLGAGSRNGGRVGVTYKYFGAPDGATAARVPISMRPEELGGDELGMNGMFTKIKPETMAAMVLTGIEGVPLHKVPPLELVVLHPDYAVVKLPMTVVDPLRGIGEGGGRRGGLHLVDGPGPGRTTGRVQRVPAAARVAGLLAPVARGGASALLPRVALSWGFVGVGRGLRASPFRVPGRGRRAAGARRPSPTAVPGPPCRVRRGEARRGEARRGHDRRCARRPPARLAHQGDRAALRVCAVAGTRPS